MKVTLEFEVTQVVCGHPDVAYALPPTSEEVARAWAAEQLNVALECFDPSGEYIGEITFGHVVTTVTP